MKKIGIVTIFDNKNIGNRLQNYALYYYISKEFDCKAETLVSTLNKKSEYCSVIKPYIAMLLSKFSKLARKRFGGRQSRYLKILKWNRKIPTRIFYECERIPERVDSEYDLFLAGSDQIWNYMFCSSRFYDFFLEFASEKKRIAISASIGNNSLPEKWESYYKEKLRSFYRISVREDAGARIIKDLLGITVPVLIDPTMALSKEEWSAVSKKPSFPIKKPYVLTYILSYELESKDKAEIEKQKDNKQYTTYEIINEDRSVMEGIGPAEFIYLIEHASLVLTDSFHGSVFSILFHTPFKVFRRKEYQMESRIDTLLSKMDLLERKNILDSDRLFNCDFTKADIELEIERKQFKEYLTKVIYDSVNHSN